MKHDFISLLTKKKKKDLKQAWRNNEDLGMNKGKLGVQMLREVMNNAMQVRQ